jgi:hypothetical protein
MGQDGRRRVAADDTAARQPEAIKLEKILQELDGRD